MNCQKCNQPLEPDAAFCGNCGERIVITQPSETAQQAQPAPTQPVFPQPNTPAPATSPIAQVIQNQPAQVPPGQLNPAVAGASANVPAYALGNRAQHRGETQAWLALLFGIAGIAGGVIMAFLGLVFGAIGIVMATMSRSGTKKNLSTAGLVVSMIATLVGLGVWVYAYNHDQTAARQATHKVDASAVSQSDLSTPCYSLGFVDKLNVKNNSDSCDAVAFDGATLETSTNAYKVYANKSSVTELNFVETVKPAIEKDVQKSLPDFTIKNEQITQFAGSSAYLVRVANKDGSVNIIEAAVLHKVATGDNVFILVHAVNAKTVDLDTLEAQWTWK